MLAQSVAEARDFILRKQDFEWMPPGLTFIDLPEEACDIFPRVVFNIGCVTDFILAVRECLQERKVVFQTKRTLGAGLHITKAVALV